MQKNADLYNGIYRELSDILGDEAAVKLYLLFKGQQISFPIRLYSPEKIRRQVQKEYNGANLHELARKYSYSEKTIRRMLLHRSEKE